MPDFKFSCPGCGQRISCDTGYSGLQINCPACQQAIVVPPAPQISTPPPPPSAPGLATRQSTAAPAVGQRFAAVGAPPKRKSNALRNVLVIAAVIVVLAVLGAGGWFGYSKFKGGHATKGNPAAQVAAPTANEAIQALSILSKVHSAYTNLTSMKANDTITVFIDLSNLTLADINPKAAASAKNARNANRHPPGIPKIITNTAELSIKRSGTNLYYLAGEATSKLDRRNTTNTFAFWKSDKGQFMFMDSHQGKTSTSYRQLPDANPANGQTEQFKKMQQLFADPANLTKIIKDLGQTGDEPVGGQDCYTLTAKVLGQKVKIWVDKSTYLIPQWQLTLGGQITDADMDDVFSLVAAGFTNMPAMQLDMIKNQVEKMTPMMAKISGTITSTSEDVEINPTLVGDDFNYPVPEGVALVQMPAATTAPAQTTSLAANQRNACINNLRQIDSAKQEWALEKGKGPNATPTEDDLKPYLGSGPNGTFPKCPAGGKYTIGKVNEPPTCSIPGHVLQ